MKVFHNGTIGRVLAVGFAICIHALFAAGAFYFGQFIGSYVFSDIPNGPFWFGVGLAILVFGGAMFGFIYLEYAREDVQAYARQRHDGGKTFHHALWILQISVILMELSSLLYRVYTINDPIKKFVVLLLGIAALVIAWALGKIVHAMANRPLEVSYNRAREAAGRSVVEDGMKYLNDMTAEQKRRFYNGDASTIDEVRDASDSERMDEARRRKEREDEVKHTQEQGQGFIKQMLSWPSKKQFDDAATRPNQRTEPVGSSNGRDPNF